MVLQYQYGNTLQTPMYMKLLFCFLNLDCSIGKLKCIHSVDLQSSVQLQSSVILTLISGREVVLGATPEEQQKYLQAEETPLCKVRNFLRVCSRICPSVQCFVSRPSSSRLVVYWQKCILPAISQCFPKQEKYADKRTLIDRRNV